MPPSSWVDGLRLARRLSHPEAREFELNGEIGKRRGDRMSIVGVVVFEIVPDRVFELSRYPLKLADEEVDAHAPSSLILRASALN